METYDEQALATVAPLRRKHLHLRTGGKCVVPLRASVPPRPHGISSATLATRHQRITSPGEGPPDSSPTSTQATTGDWDRRRPSTVEEVRAAATHTETCGRSGSWRAPGTTSRSRPVAPDRLFRALALVKRLVCVEGELETGR